MTRMFLGKLIASCLVGALSALAPAAAQAQSNHVLKMAWITPDNPADPYALGARGFRSLVEERSKGRIAVQMYPNGQLGDEKQMAEGVRFGTIDAVIVTNSVIGQIDQSFRVNDLPFLFADEAHVFRSLDGKVGEKLSRSLESKGIMVLGYMGGGFRHMINNVRPVNRMGDIKGVKYRVMQNPLYIEMFTALGGNAVPMAWGDTYTGIQQGALDGLELPIAVIESLKVNEITKYLSLTNHTYSVVLLLMNKRSFEKLPSDLRQVVMAAGREAVLAPRKMVVANEQKYLDSLKAKGMIVNTVSDPASFRAAVKPVHDKFRTSFPGAGELLDATLGTMKN